MTEHSTILIPSELLPGDGRFGSGPSKIDPRYVADLAATGGELLGTSHRRPTVRSVVGSIRAQIATLYDLPDGYEVILGVGGVTAFWDAAVFGLIDEQSAHFVCGEFSQKFADAASAAPHLSAPTVVTVEPGSAPVPVAVPGADVAAFIHNETSTGVTAPFARLSDALVLVDGTSAAGAIPFEVSDTDAYYFSPQKALGSEGGLWIAMVSPAAVERIRSVGASGRWIPAFLSLSTALENSRKDQTYNTPAITTLYLLDRQLQHLLSHGGISGSAARAAASAGHIADWIEQTTYASFFVNDEAHRSTTVSTIDFDGSIDADAVAAVLRANGIVDTESYRKLGRNQLRIATFPNIDPEDIEALTRCIDWVTDRLTA